MKQVSASVTENRQVLESLSRPHRRSISGSWIIWLNCPEIARESRPGQFVMVRCGGRCILPRPFSIHQVHGDNIALFYAVWEDGIGTGWLSQRRTGDRVELLGPLGNGFSIQQEAKNLLMVAGGIGIAPLHFLTQEALRRDSSVTLLLGAQTATQLYPEGMLPSGIKLTMVTEDGTHGKQGRVTDFLPDFANRADQVFACGPMAMHRDMADKYPRLWQRKSVQVSLEMRMGCGVGVCYGCTIKTKNGLKQVCKDGPVFELGEIRWDEVG